LKRNATGQGNPEICMRLGVNKKVGKDTKFGGRKGVYGVLKNPHEINSCVVIWKGGVQEKKGKEKTLTWENCSKLISTEV